MLDKTGIMDGNELERFQLQMILVKNYISSNNRTREINAQKHIPLYLISYLITCIKLQLHNNKINSKLLIEVFNSIDLEKLIKLIEDDGTGIKSKLILDYKRCQFYLYRNSELFIELMEYYRKSFNYLSRYSKWLYYIGLSNSGDYLMRAKDFQKFGKMINS